MSPQRFMQLLQFTETDHCHGFQDFVKRAGQSFPRKVFVAFICDDEEDSRALRLISMFQSRECAVYAARDLYFKDVTQSRSRSRIAPDDVVMLELRFGVTPERQADFDQHGLDLLMREVALGACGASRSQIGLHRFVLG